MSADTTAFSRSIAVEDLAEGQETSLSFEAEPGERAALARMLGLPDVAVFACEYRLLRRSGLRVKAQGEVRARLTQICVASLEPFEADVAEPIAVEFAPAEVAKAAAATVAHEPPPGRAIVDLPDPPDPIVDGRIDLGAIAAEFLALALDPYPRKPGADFEAPASERADADSPFAVLGRLGMRSDNES